MAVELGEAESLATEANDERERLSLIRAVRQRLESLGRAGLDRIPAPAPVAFPVVREQRTVASTLLPRAGPSSPGRPSGPSVELAPGNDDTGAGPRPRVQAPPVFAEPIAATASGDSAGTPVSSLPAPSLAVLFNSSGFDQPPAPPVERLALLEGLAYEVAVCRRCSHLAETRTQTVFGKGKADPRLMFIGEAPGADEDRLGEPFVGRAGQLLTDMITKGMGLTREQVYIANVLKCRPPQNRTPTDEEANNCFPYLEQQIAIIRPEYICLLGKVAAQAILNTTQAIGKLRGKWHRYRGIPTLATYHPSYLLRTPAAKKDAWEDLQMLMKEMGLVRPGPSGSRQ